MGWSEYIVNKYDVTRLSTVSHTFTYNGDKSIKSITALCNCLKLTRSENQLTVRWTIRKATINQSKMIEVKYTDGSREYLILKIKLKNETE